MLGNKSSGLVLQDRRRLDVRVRAERKALLQRFAREEAKADVVGRKTETCMCQMCRFILSAVTKAKCVKKSSSSKIL